MIELLKDFPPHVVAYRAIGKVNKDEYESTVMNRVNQVAEKYGKINFLVLLETDMDNYSMGALIKYVKVSFEHFIKWERMAIVSDERWVRIVYDILNPLVHGEIRTYQTNEFEAAKSWVSAPLHTANG